jgi:xylulokinase
MTGELLLTFDVGTTAIKTVLWDESLHPLSLYRAEYPLTTVGSRIEVPPAIYTDAIVAGTRRVLRAAAGGRVRALAFTTQGETLVPTNPDGHPQGNAIVWLDDRAGAEAEELGGELDPDTFYAATGLPVLNGTVPLAKAQQWLGLPSAGRGRLLLLEDYLVRWLTGATVGNRSLHTSTGWFDLRTDDYWDDALAAAGIHRSRLPDLIGSGQPVAPLLPDRARDLGLPRGTIVVSGAMDQAAAALGSGLDAPGTAGVSFGTALVVAAPSATPPHDLALRPTVYRHAVAGSYLTVLIAQTSGALLRWLRDLLSETAGYTELDRLAAQVPPGSDGLLALPFFEGGYGPEAHAQGGFLGLTLGTGRGHLARSLLEGTSYALRDLLETLATLGIAARQLRTSGGGSRSRLWQSIAADICQVPLTPLPFSEAASAGAALLAGWGSGLLEPGADPRQLNELETILPRPEPAYAAGHARYRQALDTLRPYWSGSPVRSRGD